MRKSMKRHSVFVPFEVFPNQTEKKCDDLPRFTSSQEVWEHLKCHGQKIAHRKIEWREHFDKEYLDEYRAGVGTLRILL
jgi:hypothetical protein